MDVQATYKLDLDQWGKVTFGLYGTYTEQLITQPGGQLGVLAYDCAGYFGATCGVPTPKWKHKLRVTYDYADRGIGRRPAVAFLGAVVAGRQQSQSVAAGYEWSPGDDSELHVLRYDRLVYGQQERYRFGWASTTYWTRIRRWSRCDTSRRRSSTATPIRASTTPWALPVREPDHAVLIETSRVDLQRARKGPLFFLAYTLAMAVAFSPAYAHLDAELRTAQSLRTANQLPAALAALQRRESAYPKSGRYGKSWPTYIGPSGTSRSPARLSPRRGFERCPGRELDSPRDSVPGRGELAEAQEAARCAGRLAQLPPPVAMASSLLNEGEIAAAEQMFGSICSAMARRWRRSGFSRRSA